MELLRSLKKQLTKLQLMISKLNLKLKALKLLLNNLSVNQNLWTHGGISCRAFFELSPYFVAIKLKIAGRYGDAMWYQNVIATVEIKLRM